MNLNRLQREVKSIAVPFLIPPTRAFVRYGVNDLARRSLWNHVCKRIRSRFHPFEVQTRFGFRFAGNTEETVASYVYYFGVWEPVISQWICSLPLRGRTVIDVGAHC